jgi:hypothetical protein
MSNFFDKSAGGGHKGFSLRRTLSTSKAEARGERSISEKGPFPTLPLFFVFLRAKILYGFLRAGLTITELGEHGVDHAVV